MHPNLEELLALRDGNGDPDTASHVRACETCSEEMERIENLTSSMRNLPRARPERDLWPEIRNSLETGRSRSDTWILIRNIAALLAVTVAIAMVLILRQPAEPLSEGSSHTAVPNPSIRALVQESQRLETLVSACQASKPSLSGREAVPILILEDKIATLDAFLEHESGGEAPPEDLEILWRERVDLLNTLVSAHQTRTQRTAI